MPPAPIFVVMEKPRDSSCSPPTDWLEAIERGEADLAAGRTVDASAVLDDIRSRNEAMRSRRETKAPDAA